MSEICFDALAPRPPERFPNSMALQVRGFLHEPILQTHGCLAVSANNESYISLLVSVQR
jgi:hypothetical protein